MDRKILLQFSGRHDTDNARSITESCPKDPIGILKHAILQRDDDELRTMKPCLYQSTNILCMREIKSSINFIQNVHWCRLELEKCKNERQRDERSV